MSTHAPHPQGASPRRSGDDPERHLPPHHNPLPDLVGPDAPAPEPTAAAMAAAADSPEFADLRRTFRSFAFPMTAAFLVWYFAYVLLSVYAVDLMSTPVAGPMNLGLLLGFAQFATTFGLTALYVRHANRRLDPAAAALRERLDAATTVAASSSTGEVNR